MDIQNLSMGNKIVAKIQKHKENFIFNEKHNILFLTY